MIKHFYLLYFNFVRWQERTKLLNTNRKEDVAEYFVHIILFMWLIFVNFALHSLFHFNLDWIEEIGKLKFILIFTLVFMPLRFLFLKFFSSKIKDYEYTFKQIKNWKKSNYRKRALLYSIFYFVFFIPLMVVLFGTIDD